ncbi:MAG: hypothetical protein H6707_05760 [Deltaproteobacteria bacterium]|nr:hypothetical protein [Deltaproteobacteria bacterium]
MRGRLATLRVVVAGCAILVLGCGQQADSVGSGRDLGAADSGVPTADRGLPALDSAAPAPDVWISTPGADAAVGVDSTPPTGGAPTHDQVKAWAQAYKKAHPGNGGKDWDIIAKTPAQLANDPDAQRLLSICGPDQRPVIPLLAWEYGGADHPWINPQASALVYCVYIPVNPSSSHWRYLAAVDHVTAHVYVLFPSDNPCKSKTGAAQVSDCIGDSTNFEILVDTASLHDGKDVGYNLAESSTTLELLLSDGSKVHLVENL